MNELLRQLEHQKIPKNFLSRILKMESEPILVGNLTFSDYARLEPFGWKLQNPQVLTPYKWEVLDPIAWKDFPQNYQHVTFYVGALYVLTIFSLQHWMKNRPAFHLKKVLFLWNLAFSLCTIFGASRILPGFIHIVRQPGGFYRSVCFKEGGDIIFVFWAAVSVLGKMFELGETVFVILRKRPLTFLHWYHHLCTMIVVGIVAPTMEPIGRWYIVLNSVAHSFLYPYLTLKVLGIKMSPVVAKAITALQLVEMFAGVFVNMSIVYFIYNGWDCTKYPMIIVPFSVIYFTFVILFGKLFYDSVLKNEKKNKKV